MKLKSLDIRNVRNLQSVSLSSLGPVNIFYGENGAGKSSVLEAIHMLALARSFRSTQLTPVINYNSSDCMVFSRAESSRLANAAADQTLGIQRKRRGGFLIKINGEEVRSVLALASLLPLQIINATSYLLLDSGPKQRRQFLDWGVFHVEHGFVDIWKRAQRCIKQRNAHIRANKHRQINLEPWDRELVVCAEAMNVARSRYFSRFYPVFERLLSRLVEIEGVSVEYRPGWNTEASLLEVLDEHRSRDIARGLTHYGPHRADLRVLVNGLDAAQVLSRGQLKLVVCAMRLAQMELFQRESKEQCILLIDDLPAEIDSEHQNRLCQMVDDLNSQLFITCIDGDLATSFKWKNPQETRLFHVKQGQISEPTSGNAELPV